MTPSTNISPKTKGLILGVVIGALLALGLSTLLTSNTSNDGKSEVNGQSNKESNAQNSDNSPLYWVAPMDDSYRRYKPGKSPMGMDLVPVYATADTSSNQGGGHTPGTVMIPSNVQQNMGVKVAPVTIGALEQTIAALGSVAYDEDSIVHIHPRVSGWIDTLFIKSQGEQVEKGQALYTLYSPELVTAQEEYVLALKRGDLRLIEGAAERLKTLGLSQKALDGLTKSRRISQTVTFNAPQGGVVEALNIREGFYIQPGMTLMSIAQLDTVWVIAELPEKYAQNIALHDRALVSLDELAHTSDARWKSHIEYIYPSMSDVTRTLKVRIPLNNNHHKLKPNMFTHVSIKPAERAAALLVPRSAVIRFSQGARVVLSDGKGSFKSVSVRLGQSDNSHFEVLEGLLPGDQVVVSAHFLIDSESSKNSDFNRMKAPDNQATTTGTIEAIKLPANNKADEPGGNAEVVIARGPIEKWGRGPAVMSFAVSKHIDLSQFKEGDTVRFTFVTGDEFTVIDMRKPAEHVMHSDMLHGSKQSTHVHTPKNSIANRSSMEKERDEMRHEKNSHKAKDHESMNHKEHMHHD